MKKSALKQLAQGAKYRMKNGYYQEDDSDKSILPIMEKEEKRVYSKIIELEQREEKCFKPLGELVDHSVYDGLNEQQKERYILLLSNTYLKMLNKHLALRKK